MGPNTVASNSAGVPANDRPGNSPLAPMTNGAIRAMFGLQSCAQSRRLEDSPQEVLDVGAIRRAVDGVVHKKANERP